MGRIPSGPNASKSKTGSGKRSGTCSIWSSFAQRSGSRDSFQVLVCRKVMPRRDSRHRGECATVHDRDHNAARNVLFEGRRIVATGRVETPNA